MYKVLVADSCAKEGLDVFNKYPEIQIDVKTGLKPEELCEIIGEYDGLVVRSASQFKGDVVEAAKKMKVVGRAGAGVDNIDVPLATKKGIVVMNTPGGNSEAAAELAVTMIMALSRNIVKASMSMKENKWDKNALAKTSVEVLDKTIAVIGAGNIGGIVASRAVGLKMNVLVFDPFLTEEKAQAMGVKKIENLDDIWPLADYITLHLPKNEKTVNLINKETISKMKKGVYIINCARGGIVNEDDLLDALNSGYVAGAGLDVFNKEPVDPDYALVMHPNVICTPHLGASTVEAQVNVAIAIAYQIGDYLTKGVVNNAVNVASVDPVTSVKVAPFVELSQKIGSLYGQTGNLNIKEIEMTFAGEVYQYPVNMAMNSFLMGLLKDSVEGINFVNSAMAATEKGIKIIEKKIPEGEDYASELVVKITHNEGITVVKGAVFQGGIYRIVGFNDFVVDFIPEGNLLYTVNEDVPGVIGMLGTIIGEAGVNIANMELGRNNNKEAVSFIQIDGEITDALVDSIKSKINAIKVVKAVKM
jgi:D-3-phosphoglycerate dehydrogenase / 2-oxoglutarate reductase